MLPRPRLLVLDANALLHRAFHALPPLTSPTGEPVGALYGLCLTLLNVLKTFKPTCVVAAFDRPEKTFRHEQFEAYKAQRAKAPDELVAQVDRAREVFEAFAIPTVDAKGYEADDVIGTLTTRAAKKGIESVIVTGDQDALQLVDAHTKVHLLRRGIKDTATMGPAEVRERYGLPPEQMVDYKALRGDPSDNIPGVRGVGEKTATDLLQRFGSLEGVYKNLSKVPDAVRKKLEAGKREAFLSRDLVTIVRDAPMKLVLKEHVWTSYDRQRVITLLREFGFSSLLPRLPEMPSAAGGQAAETPQQLGLSAQQPKKRTAEYQLLTNAEAVAALAEQLAASKGFVVGVETERISARTEPLHGVSIAVEPGKAYYVPAAFVSRLQSVLEDTRVPKFGHNLKHSFEVCAQHGIGLRPFSFDSMLASYVLAPGTRAHDLDSLAFMLLGREKISRAALVGRGKTPKGLSEIPPEEVAEFACEGADMILRLKDRLGAELAREPQLERVFRNIELPLIPALAHLELTGVAVDTTILSKLRQRLGRRLAALEKKIHALAGAKFNVASPQQLRDVLFDTLKLPTAGIGRTQSGLSTAAEELEKLRDVHPIIEPLLTHRELKKLKSTYLDALPKLVDTETGRVHTTYNQTVTATGRLSSSDPNLQNIPVRTDIGLEIRTAFVAGRGSILLAADYSQLQLRLVAHLARDRAMQAAFRAAKDVHAETAALAFDVPVERVTPAQRRVAKTLNFGILYGMGPQAFAGAAGISLGEAQRFIDAYFRTYRGIADYMEEAKALAATQGYIEALSGRRRYLPEITSQNPQLRGEAERMAINHPAQGSEADILKKAMIVVYEHIADRHAPFEGVRMILTVHDELVFEVPRGRERAVGQAVKGLMEGVEHLSVPLVVDVRVGKNWGALRPL